MRISAGFPVWTRFERFRRKTRRTRTDERTPGSTSCIVPSGAYAVWAARPDKSRTVPWETQLPDCQPGVEDHRQPCDGTEVQWRAVV